VTLIPTIKLGLWNAWILTLFVLIHPYIMLIVDKLAGTGDINKKMGDDPAEQGKNPAVPIPTLLLFGLFILSIFLPLKLGTEWFYAGVTIYLIGAAMFMTAINTAAKTPSGQLFTEGMYRYSRHPLYLSFLIIFLGISLASASWLFLLLSMGWMTFPISQVRAEEQGCLEIFGSQYREYMSRTPRWLGVPKSK
jgi:protein-S-isoprenylcysteine O-methyltransferase Ste14